MKHPKGQSGGTGCIILRQMQPHFWVFDYPGITPQVSDVFYDALDDMRQRPAKAKKVLQDLIKNNPEFIDAYHHLALTFYWQGDLKKSAEIWRKGVEFALRFFPSNFSMQKDRLEWGFMENRPFLRLYQGHGLACLGEGNPREAVEIFENLLQMNPNDNQGNRALAVKCHFLLEDPAAVIRICDRYPNNSMEQLMFGRALALFQLGRVPEAEKIVKQAVKLLPLIAKELLKTSHRRPAGWDGTTIKFGGKDQAYAYWQEQGVFWERTPGALEWLRQTLE